MQCTSSRQCAHCCGVSPVCGRQMLTLSELRFVRSHSPVGRGPLAAEPAPESEPEHPPLVEQQLREQGTHPGGLR